MNPLAKLLAIPQAEKKARGLLHTPREILQQPESWWGSYEKVLQSAPEVESFLKRAGVRRSGATVFLVGAGTSDYIGKTLAAILRRSWQCEVQAIPSTDLLTSMNDFILPGRSYLWISFSRSGDSSEGVALLESALESHPEIHQLVVCCNREGRMTRFNDRESFCRLILGDEVNDRGLAMTSSFSNMVVAGQCLAHLHDLGGYRATLEQLILAASSLLPAASQVAEDLVAEGFSRICFLGTGPLKAVAKESALKVLELTAGRVVSFSESFLGVRHGPLSAINHDTLLAAFVSGDARRRSYEMDLLEEIHKKNLAKKILVVAPVSAIMAVESALKNSIFLPLDFAIEDYYRPPVDILVGQLLGLFASIKQGLKPDTPSPGGAISRVVTQVRIH